MVAPLVLTASGAGKRIRHTCTKPLKMRVYFQGLCWVHFTWIQGNIGAAGVIPAKKIALGLSGTEPAPPLSPDAGAANGYGFYAGFPQGLFAT